MAGPVIQILTHQIFTEDDKELIVQMIIDAADSVEGDDFWIQQRPLGYSLGFEYPEQIEEYEDFAAQVGWHPKDCVILYAMSNQAQDHQRLGEITLALAKPLNARIDFGDHLKNYTRDTALLSDSGLHHNKQESLLSAELFERWLNHPDFKLVK